MFLSAFQNYLIAIVVPIVVLQYAFALFCLLKLAYLDIPRNRYILWNLFILIVFFIGGIAFLVYYCKHPEKRIPKDPVLPKTGDERQFTEQDAAQVINAVDSEAKDGSTDTAANAEKTESAEIAANKETNGGAEADDEKNG